MASHAAYVPPDGNGFKGGIRLSFPAASFLLAMAVAAGSLLGVIRSGDLELLATKVGAVERRVETVEHKEESDRVELTNMIEASRNERLVQIEQVRMDVRAVGEKIDRLLLIMARDDNATR